MLTCPAIQRLSDAAVIREQTYLVAGLPHAVDGFQHLVRSAAQLQRCGRRHLHGRQRLGVDCCGTMLRLVLSDQVQVPACCPVKVNRWVKGLWLLCCHRGAQLPDVHQGGWPGQSMHIPSCSTRCTALHLAGPHIYVPPTSPNHIVSALLPAGPGGKPIAGELFGRSLRIVQQQLTAQAAQAAGQHVTPDPDMEFITCSLDLISGGLPRERLCRATGWACCPWMCYCAKACCDVGQCIPNPGRACLQTGGCSWPGGPLPCCMMAVLQLMPHMYLCAGCRVGRGLGPPAGAPGRAVAAAADHAAVL